MTHTAFSAIQDYRAAVASLVNRYAPLSAELVQLTSQASKDDTPPYSHDTPVVYNTAWDGITEEDDIKLIVVGDNPGKEEQLVSRRAYLVGQSGRVAEGFFRRNPALGVDFRRNALITNKTPIHTAKTKHLRYLSASGSPDIAEAIQESQLEMARLTARLHQRLFAEGGTRLYMVGYAELKGKGIFIPYRDELVRCYQPCPETWEHVLAFQHFSMNRFLVDLKQYMEENGQADTAAALDALGRRHRDEIWIRLASMQ
ncbi:MAG: hypothetical protein IJU95_04295 [Treponema sp.]|nr:hypothetical protein [Treponema sp.]